MTANKATASAASTARAAKCVRFCATFPIIICPFSGLFPRPEPVSKRVLPASVLSPLAPPLLALCPCRGPRSGRGCSASPAHAWSALVVEFPRRDLRRFPTAYATDYWQATTKITMPQYFPSPPSPGPTRSAPEPGSRPLSRDLPGPARRLPRVMPGAGAAAEEPPGSPATTVKAAAPSAGSTVESAAAESEPSLSSHRQSKPSNTSR